MELKKCPFCGEKAIAVEIFRNICVVGCERCKAITDYFRTKEQAAEAWNRRAD